MKSKIITARSEEEFEKKLNEFIINKNIVDIKFSCEHGITSYYYALILYEEK